MLIIPHKQGYSAIFCITFVATYSSYSTAVYNINFNPVYRTENILVPHSRVPVFTFGVGGVRVAPFFSFLCFCVLFVCVLCAKYCQCLWIVHSCLPLRFSLTFIQHTLCMLVLVLFSSMFIETFS